MNKIHAQKYIVALKLGTFVLFPPWNKMSNLSIMLVISIMLQLLIFPTIPIVIIILPKHRTKNQNPLPSHTELNFVNYFFYPNFPEIPSAYPLH